MDAPHGGEIAARAAAARLGERYVPGPARHRKKRSAPQPKKRKAPRAEVTPVTSVPEKDKEKNA